MICSPTCLIWLSRFGSSGIDGSTCDSCAGFGSWKFGSENVGNAGGGVAVAVAVGSGAVVATGCAVAVGAVAVAVATVAAGAEDADAVALGYCGFGVGFCGALGSEPGTSPHATRAAKAKYRSMADPLLTEEMERNVHGRRAARDRELPIAYGVFDALRDDGIVAVRAGALHVASRGDREMDAHVHV